MKKMFLFVLCCLCFSVGSTAGAVDSQKIHQLVDQFYLQKSPAKAAPKHLLGFLNLNPKPNGFLSNQGCGPGSGSSCMDVACEKLGSFGCNDLDEIKTVGLACRGNWNGDCLTAACEKLGSFGCNDMGEITVVARACVGNANTQCFESVCQKLGSFGCNDQNEVTEVLNACSGNTP